MGNISDIGRASRMSVQIRVLSYLRDHRFEAAAVFPAVESMQLLARAACEFDLEADVRHMSHAAFGKFLALDAQEDAIEAFVEFEGSGRRCCEARLMTRRRVAGSSMSRVMEHARVCFGATEMPTDPGKPPAFDRSLPEIEIPARAVYAELVPMGPAYQNLAGPVQLYSAGAAAQVRTPDLAEADGPLGSPFVLDAAFHAACVWGQRYSGFIGFPVGFDSRCVIDPARRGETYTVCALPVRQDAGENEFDLWISRGRARPCEVIRGVRMRDVTGGRKAPPAWVRKK